MKKIIKHLINPSSDTDCEEQSLSLDILNGTSSTSLLQLGLYFCILSHFDYIIYHHYDNIMQNKSILK